MKTRTCGIQTKREGNKSAGRWQNRVEFLIIKGVKKGTVIWSAHIFLKMRKKISYEHGSGNLCCWIKAFWKFQYSGDTCDEEALSFCSVFLFLPIGVTLETHVFKNMK